MYIVPIVHEFLQYDRTKAGITYVHRVELHYPKNGPCQYSMVGNCFLISNCRGIGIMYATIGTYNGVVL